MISNRPPTNAARIALAASIPWALGGCAYIAGINEPARAGYAHVSIPRLDSGRPAVTVFHVRSNTGLFVELDIPPDIHEIASFALRPGDHTLEVACTRPNAVDIVDGWWFFKVAVEANQSYLLDCAPMKVGKDDYDNHFSLTPVESPNTKEPPLELEPWLGCYDVTADRADAHVSFGRLRLTDHLEPFTAGTYTMETVKQGERPLGMMEWWPMSATSIHLGLGDGYTGWAGALEQTPAGLQGSAAWSTDTGKKDRGWTLRASRIACDP